MVLSPKDVVDATVGRKDDCNVGGGILWLGNSRNPITLIYLQLGNQCWKGPLRITDATYKFFD